MRKLIYILLMMTVSFSGLKATTPSNILQTIEENNITLKSAREQANIQKADARIEGNLENPEIEMEYMFGNKAAGYAREKEFSISQGFDFPTVYYHRNKLITSKDSLILLNYLKERQEILLEAKLLCIELICLQKQQKFQTERYEHAISLQALYDKKFKEGAATIIDINKIKLELLNSKSSFQFYKMATESCIKKLEAMNGNEPLDLSSLSYERIIIPANFEEYYSLSESKNPELKLLSQNHDVSKREVSLAKSMALPKLNVGYKTGITGDEKMRGIIAGISIPLWEHRNTIKRSKNQVIVSELVLDNAKISFRNESLLLYQNAKSQKAIFDEYADMNIEGQMQSLKRSLDAGQISLLEYFNELIILFDSYKTVLELERDLQISQAQLMKFLL